MPWKNWAIVFEGPIWVENECLTGRTGHSKPPKNSKKCMVANWVNYLFEPLPKKLQKCVAGTHVKTFLPFAGVVPGFAIRQRYCSLMGQSQAMWGALTFHGSETYIPAWIIFKPRL